MISGGRETRCELGPGLPQVRHDGQEGLHLVSPLLARADPGPGTQHQGGEGAGEAGLQPSQTGGFICEGEEGEETEEE